MSKQNDQIDELNSTVKVRLAQSKIHGVGIIAIRDIRKGEILHCFARQDSPWYDIPFGSLNKLFPEIKEIILERWASIVNGSHFKSPNDDQWLILFMNHSETPNYEIKSDTALCDIKKGEEVTSDYRTMENYQKVFPFLK